MILSDCKDLADVRKAVAKSDIIWLELADPSTCLQEGIYATHISLEAIGRSNVDTIVFAPKSHRTRF